MSIIEDKVRKILRDIDIEGLIASGAPDDEYESEADYIASAIEKLDPEMRTREALLVIVQAVWKESFSLSNDDLLLRGKEFDLAVSDFMEV